MEDGRWTVIFDAVVILSLLGYAHCSGTKNTTTINQLNGDGQKPSY
jgi:hypothetical protein